ncbi:SGNH hydrolase-type esterase domain-containing protein [Chytridium lagenaria]|nr:SGNH hydrolase-type esterase domain-containing protein [Chytridium lagenaria]
MSTKPNANVVKVQKSAIRDKTRQGCIDHLSALKPTDTTLLLGDSHIEHLLRFPQLALPNTWLCGVGGDRISQLRWRLENDENCGYTQLPVANEFTHIGIMIGTNNLMAIPFNEKQLRTAATKVNAIHDVVRQRWPHAQISVLPIPPIPLRGMSERSSEAVDGYNDALVKVGLPVVQDFWADIDLEVDFEDLVHLSLNGYVKFVGRLRERGVVASA